MEDTIEKILIRVPGEIKRWITAKAKRYGISVNALISHELRTIYEKEETKN